MLEVHRSQNDTPPKDITTIPLPAPKKEEKGKSYSDRVINLKIEGADEWLAFTGKTCTTVAEIRDLLAEYQGIDAGKVILKKKCATGLQVMKIFDECPSVMVVSGIKSFKKAKKQYEHPIVVVGAGLGGMQCMIDFLENGRKDVICIEKHKDFGGHSWIYVPNKYTKLQTERGTYHVDFLCRPNTAVPQKVNDHTKYPPWPSRDTILLMMREGAKKHGLYEHTMFNCELEKVSPKKGAYALHWLPSDDDEKDGGLLMAAAVSSWPGFLHLLNIVDYPGEEDFGGYIEYSSFDRVDYTQATGKNVMMHGHGAFSIENVRTLCEHRCKKVYVVCRYRNLSGTKMTSWLVGFLPQPCPGVVLVKSLQRMYDLAGYDLWTESPSVNVDANRTSAMLSQKTIFGVSDPYFLACYYGLAEIVIGEIARLSHHKIHMKNGRKIEAEMIIKATGTMPSFKIQKQLGIKEIVGSWANGDPLRPVNISSKGVQARNFGSFSIGPGLAPSVKMLNWFIDYPEDYEKIRPGLTVNKSGDWPAYVCNATFMMPLFIMVSSTIPELGMLMTEAGDIKSRKHQFSHPLKEFLAECKAEWEMYIKYFKENNMVDDRPDPEYPYTEELMEEMLQDCLRMQGQNSYEANGSISAYINN